MICVTHVDRIKIKSLSLWIISYQNHTNHVNEDFYLLSLHICVLTLRTPHADDEAVQLTAQEVAFLLQLLDALLQPGVLLQSDVQVSSQVGDQDEGAVLRMRRLLHHRLCRGRKQRRPVTSN